MNNVLNSCKYYTLPEANKRAKCYHGGSVTHPRPLGEVLDV